MNLSRSTIYSTSLLAFFSILLFTSCGNKGPIAENVKVTDVQIIALALSSKDVPAMASTFFSIDNTKSEIYNAIQLPYGTDIDSVKIEVKMFKANQLRIAQGDSEYGEWLGPKDVIADSVSLAAAAGKLRLHVRDRDDASVEKEYTVRIKVYDYDPETIDWTPLPACNLPAQTNASPNWTYIHDGKVYLFRAGETNELFVANQDNPLSWQVVPMTGFTGRLVMMMQDVDSERLYAEVELPSGSDEIWTTTLSAGKLSWTKVTSSLDGKNIQLLGKLNNDICLSAIVDGERSFYVIKDGVAAKMAAAPSDFPEAAYTILPTTLYHMPVVRLIGGGLKSESLRSNNNWNERGAQLWYTSNGRDWLRPTPSVVGDVPMSDRAPGALAVDGDTIYYFGRVYEDKNDNRSFPFYSRDGGATWTLGNITVMMPPMETFGTIADFAFSDKDGNIYLGSSVSSETAGGAMLWRGRLRLDAQN